MHFQTVPHAIRHRGIRESVRYALLLPIAAPALFLIFMACTPSLKPQLPTSPLQRLSPEKYPLFEDDLNFKDLQHGIEMSLAYLRRLPAGTPIDFGPDQYSVEHVIRSLENFAALVASCPTTEQLNRVLREQYAVYQSTAPSVLFTGYYEPLLPGSLRPDKRYPIPVYSRPSDLVTVDLSPFALDLKGRHITGRYTGRTLEPYPDREQIRNNNDFGMLAPPIAWLRDEIDLFILQIQGSGKIRLETGEEIHIQYDANNGRPYRSIGRLLIDQGKISPQHMSMQAIRTYLKKKPAEIDAILNHNPRYIFFRKGHGAPLGSLGVDLTARRSIAVDRNLFPPAAVTFVQTRIADVTADGTIRKWVDYGGFALAQDAGSAITGPGRVDLYMGNGLQAEVAASHLKHPGQLYFLILRN